MCVLSVCTECDGCVMGPGLGPGRDIHVPISVCWPSVSSFSVIIFTPLWTSRTISLVARVWWTLRSVSVGLGSVC